MSDHKEGSDESSANAVAPSSDVNSEGSSESTVENHDIVYIGENSRIERIEEDGRAVAMKLLTDDCPSPEDVCSLYNEFNILTKHLSGCSAARKAIKDDKVNGKHTLYLEWVKGTTLKQWIHSHPPPESYQDKSEDLLTRLKIAVAVAEAIGIVHHECILHNDILSDNVMIDVIDVETSKIDVKLIDFGFASTMQMVESDDGGLHVNDDFFALGSVFHDLFIEYKGDDTLSGRASRNSYVPVKEISIKSSSPKKPPTESGNVPRSINKLIADLMCLGDEADPYIDADDIVSDMQQMISIPEVFLFDRKPEVYTGALEFNPKTLYGRDNEIAQLRDAYRRVDEYGGQPEMVLVSGYSGTGKSALVGRINSAVSESGGFFVSGKFDQLCRAQPYTALITAMKELCQILLEKDKTTIDRISASIKESVAGQGKVLTEVVPTITHIIGEQPEVNKLSGKEAQNRLIFVLRMFFRAISTPENPLVLFLDDLQWADSASLDLIKILVTDTENKYFLFVGAYRDNEVNETHPFMVLVNEIERRKVKVSTIKIDNLSPEHVSRLISDVLGTSQRFLRPLSDAIYKKTSGNVFFVIHFLKSLFSEGTLFFSFDTYKWDWDEPGLHSKDISDNVVGLMASKIQKLSSDDQRLMMIAAAVGSYFDEATLRIILVPHVSSDALDEGKRNGNSTSFKMGTFAGSQISDIIELLVDTGLINTTRVEGQYKFTHDRIQQAAYSLIPKDERGHLHLQIGNMMLHNATELELERLLFVTVDHLNAGSACIKDDKEKKELVQLNLRAAHKAIHSSAHLPAVAYLKTGIRLLQCDRWDKEYDTSLELFTCLSESHYCAGNLDKTGPLVEEVFKHARCFEDKYRAHTCLVKTLTGQGKLQEAIDTALDGLAELGEPLPKVITKKVIIADLVRTKVKLLGKSDSYLSSLPEMEDRGKEAAMSILNAMLAIAYIGRPEMMPLVAFRMVRLTLHYGTCQDTAFGFAVYGLVLGGLLNDARGAYRFGQLALKHEKRDTFAHVSVAVYACINHWVEPVELTIEPLMNAHRVGMETGELEFAGYGAFNSCSHAFQCGKPLALLEQDMRVKCQLLANYSIEIALSLLLPYRQALLNLMGRSDDPVKLTGEAMDEEKHMQLVKETSNTLALMSMYLNTLMVAFLFGDYDRAADVVERSRNFLELAPSKYECVTHAFYFGLASLALAQKTNEKKWKKLAHWVMKKIKMWAKPCPSNCLHKLLLLQAEKAVLKGKYDKAKKRFDAAIECAHRNGFVNEEALANERAAIFCTAQNQSRADASRYFAKSRELYGEWGAQAKVDHIKEQYGNYLSLG